MAFVVRVIEGESSHERRSNDRDSQDVAEDIRACYEQTARLGGTVLAGYTMNGETHSGREVEIQGSTLYLVAQIPDIPSE